MLSAAARSTPRPRALAWLVAGGLAAGVLAVCAGPAAAAPHPVIAGACLTSGAEGDTARLCVRMHHTGLRVNWVEFVRTRRGGGAIRDHHTEVTLSRPDGSAVARLMSLPSDGVVRGRVRERQRIGLRLARGGEVCASFFERDALQGSVCFPLRAPRKNTAAA